jgi:hypothetical protein
MKTTILAIVLLSCCAALRAESPSVQFAGVKYQLATVEVGKDGAVTNEYVPDGESINSWTTLLTVRHWPKVKKLGDAAGAWLKMIQPLLTQKVGAFKSDSAKSDDDLIFEAWLAAPDRSYIEIDLHRFVIEQGTDGVKAYQFAQKVVMTGGKGDPTSFVKNRSTLFGDLGKLQLSPVKKKE